MNANHKLVIVLCLSFCAGASFVANEYADVSNEHSMILALVALGALIACGVIIVTDEA